VFCLSWNPSIDADGLSKNGRFTIGMAGPVWLGIRRIAVFGLALSKGYLELLEFSFEVKEQRKLKSAAY